MNITLIEIISVPKKSQRTNAQDIVQVVENNMKKSLLLLAIFIIFSIIVKSCPIIDLWDKAFILHLQGVLKNLPLWIPLLPDCKLYSIMIALPLIVGSILFFQKKEYKSIVFLYSIPLVTFLLNCIIKPLIHRPRPPFEMQLVIHPHSFSYVSSHSLVTICLWGMVIYFIHKYCKNKIWLFVGIILSIIWILFVGISRIWLGVHNPTDVIGAYLLGVFLLSIYTKLFSKGVDNE